MSAFRLSKAETRETHALRLGPLTPEGRADQDRPGTPRREPCLPSGSRGVTPFRAPTTRLWLLDRSGLWRRSPGYTPRRGGCEPARETESAPAGRTAPSPRAHALCTGRPGGSVATRSRAALSALPRRPAGTAPSSRRLCAPRRGPRPAATAARLGPCPQPGRRVLPRRASSEVLGDRPLARPRRARESSPRKQNPRTVERRFNQCSAHAQGDPAAPAEVLEVARILFVNQLRGSKDGDPGVSQHACVACAYLFKNILKDFCGARTQVSRTRARAQPRRCTAARFQMRGRGRTWARGKRGICTAVCVEMVN